MKILKPETIRLRAAFAALALVASAAVWSGCGDDGSTTNNTTTPFANDSQSPGNPGQASGSSEQQTTEEAADLPAPAFTSPERLTGEFPTVRGSLVTGYKEAGDDERAAASELVEDFMAGRANDDLDAVCASLSAEMQEYVEGLVEEAPNPPNNCPDSLALAIDEYSSVYSATNTMTGPLAGLLVNGNRGYALYHGKRDVDYLVNLIWEDGGWKVNTLEVMGL